MLRTDRLAPLLAALLLAVPACEDAPTQALSGPQDGSTSPLASHQAPGVIASAGGGGNWTLLIDGFPPIDQVLGFQARKFADGSVRGHIDYHQSFAGDDLRFNATVTCLGVYDGGTRAKFGGEIQLSNDPAFPPGGFIWFQVIDNGEGSAAAPDQSTGSGFGDEEGNEAFCASPAPPNPIFVADIDGDIQVSGD